MVAFILRRFLSSIVVLFCVVTITVLLALMMPGGPIDREKELPEHIKQAQLERYKLAGTRWQQYSSYMADLVRGDLRVSFRYRDWSVEEVLAQKLPASIHIGAVAFVIASIGGVLAGGLAVNKGFGLRSCAHTQGAAERGTGQCPNRRGKRDGAGQIPPLQQADHAAGRKGIPSADCSDDALLRHMEAALDVENSIMSERAGAFGEVDDDPLTDAGGEKLAGGGFERR